MSRFERDLERWLALPSHRPRRDWQRHVLRAIAHRRRPRRAWLWLVAMAGCLVLGFALGRRQRPMPGAIVSMPPPTIDQRIHSLESDLRSHPEQSEETLEKLRTLRRQRRDLVAPRPYIDIDGNTTDPLEGLDPETPRPIRLPDTTDPLSGIDP